MRRILFIILIITFLGGGIWYFFIRSKQTTIAPGTIGNFFPSSVTGNTLPGGLGDDTTATNGSIAAPVPTPGSPFTQVTGSAIAGYSAFPVSHTVSTPATDPKQKPTVSTTTDHIVRFVSRANGYVYEIKNGDTPLQITNISIPNVYEALFTDNNKTAVLRFLRQDNRNIASFAVPIPDENPDGTRTQINGTFLPENTLSLTVSPDQTALGRVVLAQNGSIVQTATSKNISIKTLYTSPLKEWLLSWSQKNVLYLQTKAAASVNGFLYALAPGSAPKRILGDIPGLTTAVSPSGTYVLYSQSGQNSFTTSIFNTKTNTTTPLNLAILPEKCVWTAQENLICAGNNTVTAGAYPDAWYAGTTHFSDKIYRINVVANTFEVLYPNTDKSFDMVNLQLDEVRNILYFIDKSTGILWSYAY